MSNIITCIECPKGCEIEVDLSDGIINRITGNLCHKGDQYARQEIIAPQRILTATVLADNLSLQLVPVRTDKPIPKNKIFEAMGEIHAAVISSPVKAGDVIIHGIVGSDANLIATRDVL